MARQTAAPRVVSDGDSLPELKAAATAQIGESRCTTVGQCRAIPFGAKPCGGPWSYLVYSTATTDSARLATAVQRYNVAEAESNRRLGRVSDCSVVAPPAIGCLNGRCIVTSR